MQKELVNILPLFDARCFCYPNQETLIDYFKWRYMDCHINNLYNTCLWNLIKYGKKTKEQAEDILG